MGYPKLVVYMRHGESEGNVATPEEMLRSGLAVHAYRLTERGREQAATAGRWLRSEYGSFDHLFTSTYERTRETLRAAGFQGLATDDSRLDETHFGIHHFHARADIDNLYPHEHARQKRLTNYWYRPFGGENWPDAELRLHSFLNTLRHDWSGKKVLIVAHGNLFRAWRRVVEGAGIGNIMSMTGAEAIANCGIASYRGVGAWPTPWNRKHLKLERTFDPWRNRTAIDSREG